ncbi:unnamed protein product [Brassica rapa subsp. trilocularis]
MNLEEACETGSDIDGHVQQGDEDTAPFQQPAVHKFPNHTNTNHSPSALHDDLYLITSNHISSLSEHTRPDPNLCPLGETRDHIISSLNLFSIHVNTDTNTSISDHTLPGSKTNLPHESPHKSSDPNNITTFSHKPTCL